MRRGDALKHLAPEVWARFESYESLLAALITAAPVDLATYLTTANARGAGRAEAQAAMAGLASAAPDEWWRFVTRKRRGRRRKGGCGRR